MRLLARLTSSLAEASVTPSLWFRQAGGAVTYARGCNVSDDRGKTPPAVVEAGLAAALEVAKGADAVVLGLGLCGDNYGGGPPKEDPTCFTITESGPRDS